MTPMNRRTAIVGGPALMVSALSTSEGSVNAAVPDPRIEWPPFFTTQWKVVQNWLGASYFKRTDLKCGSVVIICLDMAPFSGQPERHVVLYQSRGDDIEGLATFRFFTPPSPDVDLQFKWNDLDARIEMMSGKTLCGRVELGPLLI
jgi:hypothetical protein